MGDVIDLRRERVRRSGDKPPLRLIGVRSRIVDVLRTSLLAVDASDRPALLTLIASGSYQDMICQLVKNFEIVDSTQARAVS